MRIITHYIYFIYHISKKKYYVGETKDYIKRFELHMKNGEKGYQSIDKLYAKRGLYLAMHKYGITDFIFRVIEECDYEERYLREAFWICKLKSHTLNGYNSIVGIDGVQLKAMCDNIYSNLSVDDCKRILAKRNKIEYIEGSNYIEPDLVEYASILKKNKKIDKVKSIKQNKTVNIEHKKDKCEKGYTNIYILKDLTSNKIYISQNQLNNEADIIEWHRKKFKEYIVKNISVKSANHELYEYININRTNIQLKVEYINMNVKVGSLDNRERYKILRDKGYSIENLISRIQREQISNEIKQFNSQL